MHSLIGNLEYKLNKNCLQKKRNYKIKSHLPHKCGFKLVNFVQLTCPIEQNQCYKKGFFGF